jgi:hypothetical protein
LPLACLLAAQLAKNHKQAKVQHKVVNMRLSMIPILLKNTAAIAFTS